MTTNSGTIIAPVLIVIGVTIMALYAGLFTLGLQVDFSQRDIARDEALQIAEAGAEYYRWHLAHDTDDFQDGTGGPGPYEHEYKDPQGNTVGAYSLEIDPPNTGSTVVTVRSTGWTNAYPNVKRTVEMQLGKDSLAKYSLLIDASVWFGPSSVVYGNIHSNNGIRMDGTNYGVVASAKDTYHCGSETGCSPPSYQNGVWGAGGDQALWQFPTNAVDFDGIAVNFLTLRDIAQTQGQYFGESGAAGYHVVFNTNDFNVYRVTVTDDYRGYRVPGEGLGAQGQGGCRSRDQIIVSETLLGTYSIADNPIIFAEDHVWVEGIVDGQVTIVAAGFPVTSRLMNIWLNGNLTYADYDGTDTIGVLAQNDILMVRNLSDDTRFDGAFMAHGGQIIRHGYFSWCEGTTNAVYDKLTLFGALISNNKSYWNYGNPVQSGFIDREIIYDPRLIYSPPPFFPTGSEFQILSWKEL